MTDPWNIFTTADPTANSRLPWSEPASSGADFVDAVRSVTTTLVFAVIVGTGLAFSPTPRVSGELDPPVDIYEDPLLEAIWTVNEDARAISDDARDLASRVLREMRHGGAAPERVLADPDGGFGLYVFGAETIQGGAHARYARVGVTADCEVLALCVDRRTGAREVWTATNKIAQAVRRVSEFVAA